MSATAPRTDQDTPPRRRRIVIDFAPRGLSTDEAARYVGIGRTTFEELVASRKMPRPKRIGSRVIYDRFEIDVCFSDLESAPANRLDELLSGA